MKTNYHTISFFLLSVAILMGCHHATENKAMAGIKKMPRFKILSIDSATCLNSENIPAGKASVFFYFDPECEHCQKETDSIIKNKEKLKNVQFYFLSNSTPKEVSNFYNYYGLAGLKNVFVGIDYEYSFFNVFLPPSIPYMAIYNSDKRLSKVYYGAADIASLIAYTRN